MTDLVAQIARCVLYEGHVLWPYRRSALKNRDRWIIGGLYPDAYARAAAERSAASFESLIEGRDPAVQIELRFLHAVRRQVVTAGAPADEAEIDGTRYVSWDEATERTARLDATSRAPVGVPAGSDVEAVGGGVELRRAWERVGAEIDVRVDRVAPGVGKLHVEVRNTSAFAGTQRSDAVRQALLSAHVIAHVEGGEFVSALDPPPHLADAANGCSSDGLWPVLVGEEESRDTVLASPIILYDYPRVAPESPGDFFDGCEIDQLLVLNILGMTDAERAEARASDPRSREIIERTEAMSPHDLMRLHGTIRERRVPG
jgi:hypothetical protein